MNAKTILKNRLAVLGVSALLVACGQVNDMQIPTVDDVRAWRLERENTRSHKVKTYEVTDLSCTAASKAVVEEVRRAYTAIGMGNDAVKSMFLCSYTINASFEGLDKEGRQSKDYELANVRVSNEKFGQLRHRDGYKWVGGPRRPRSTQ